MSKRFLSSFSLYRSSRTLSIRTAVHDRVSLNETIDKKETNSTSMNDEGMQVSFLDIKFFKLFRKNRDEDPRKLVDPKILAQAKRLSWKALFYATLINIFIAYAIILFFKYYIGIHSIQQFQTWLRGKLGIPERPQNDGSQQGSKKLREFFRLKKEQQIEQDEEHDFNKK